MSKKTGSKAKKAVITVLIVLVALVAIVFIGARIYFRAPVSSYYKASEKAFVIPGLMDNMVPQGFDYIESEILNKYCNEINYKWTKGHADNIYNNKCDKLAVDETLY